MSTRRRLWIVRHETHRMDVLTVEDGDGEEILPVFSFEEEAEMFVLIKGPGAGWRAMEATPGEVASVLCGPCAVVDRVALDPPPRICSDGLIRLVSLSRKGFLETLPGGKRAPGQTRSLHREDEHPKIGIRA